MIELKFGVPTQARAKKEEKFPENAVVTMLEWKGKGTAKKFEFNKKAEELLGFEEESSIAISFMEGNIYLVKAMGTEDESYKLTKGSPRSFSNARVYEYFEKFKTLDVSKDNEFELVVGEAMYGDSPVCELVPIVEEINLEDGTIKENVENVSYEEVPQEEYQEENNN
jgi:hypothetical protein